MYEIGATSTLYNARVKDRIAADWRMITARLALSGNMWFFHGQIELLGNVRCDTPFTSRPPSRTMRIGL